MSPLLMFRETPLTVLIGIQCNARLTQSSHQVEYLRRTNISMPTRDLEIPERSAGFGSFHFVQPTCEGGFDRSELLGI